ncbi:hypothetical protein [Gottschalkia acidurici]|nr:hypothetical protein [Gottschalkia acidurici]
MIINFNNFTSCGSIPKEKIKYVGININIVVISKNSGYNSPSYEG